MLVDKSFAFQQRDLPNCHCLYPLPILNMTAHALGCCSYMTRPLTASAMLIAVHRIQTAAFNTARYNPCSMHPIASCSQQQAAAAEAAAAAAEAAVSTSTSTSTAAPGLIQSCKYQRTRLVFARNIPADRVRMKMRGCPCCLHPSSSAPAFGYRRLLDGPRSLAWALTAKAARKGVQVATVLALLISCCSPVTQRHPSASGPALLR